MGKIGDLWVKLGLRNKEFKAGLDESEKKLGAFGKGIAKMSEGAKLAWAAVAAAVVKFATDAVKMTQKWGDSWNVTMSGVKAAYGTFVRQLSSGEGWSNLFSNMAEASRRARQVAADLDEVFERRVSYGYQEAETEKEIANLQLIMNDTSKSNKEREAAANLIIEKEQELGRVKKDINQQEAEDMREKFRNQTHLNDEQIDYLVKSYNENRKVIKDAREYNEQRAKLEKNIAAAQKAADMGRGRQGGDYLAKQLNEAKAALDNLDASTSKTIKDVAAATKLYDKGNDELVKGMADAEVAVIKVDTETAHAQMRATRLLGQLKNTPKGSSTDPDQGRAAGILQRAQDAAKGEVEILTEKYMQEKALLEKYHLDTTALWDEYVSNIASSVEKMDIGGDGISGLIADMFNDSALLGALGLDESAIGEAYLKRISEAIADAETDELTESLQSEIDKAMEGVQAEILEPIQIDATPLEGFGEELKRHLDMIKDLTDDFNRSVVAGISDGCQEIMNQLTGVSEFNPGAILASILTPLADMAIRSGEVIMAEGVGIKAVVDGLKTLNPAFPLVAGAALIAIGSAAKAGLQALASAGASGSSTAATSYQGGTASEEIQNIATELTVHVEGRISGSDIVLSGQRTTNGWNR